MQFLLPLVLSLVSSTAPVDPPVDYQLLKAAAYVRLGYPVEAIDLLASLEIPEKNRWFRSVSRVLSARALIDEHRPAEAIPILEEEKDGERKGLRFFAAYHLARAQMAVPDPASALVLLSGLEKSRLAHALTAEIRISGLEAAIAAGEGKAIKRWAKKVNSTKSIQKSRRLALSIPALAARGQAADLKCLELFSSFPCEKLPEVCSSLDLRSRLKPGGRFERAERLFSCWGYEDAAAEFTVFLSDKRYGKYVNRAHFYLAEIHARKLRDDRATAFAHYQHVYRHGGGNRSYALYQMGRCRMNLEQYDEAIRLFESYMKKYPSGEHAERCLYYVGWLPYDHNKFLEALPGFDRYLARHKKGKLRTYVLWFRAWSLFRLGRFREAADGFEGLGGFGNDIVAGKAWYWLGRTNLILKEEAKARGWFEKTFERWPLSYYGMLSWIALKGMGGEPAHPYFTRDFAAPEVPTPAHYSRHLTGKRAEPFGPVLDAAFVGELGAARRLFKPLENTFESLAGRKDATAHYWLYSILEEPTRLRKWGRKRNRMRGRFPTEKGRLAWMMEFPLAYGMLMEVMSEKTGLPPYFLCSIMRQESRYRRGVVSWADAVGLLQVIPPTGAKTAGLMGVPFARRRLPEPEYNIKLGAGYLGLLAGDFHHQLTLVAASYNAGPDPVRKFVADTHEGGWDAVIEGIAYNEARNYCRKVTGHVLKYAAIFASPEEQQVIFSKLFPETPRFDIGGSVTY